MNFPFYLLINNCKTAALFANTVNDACFHQVVSFCPETLPPTIEEPLLTPQSIRLMNDEVSEEEDHLWQSLGDAWNVPR